MSKCQRSSRLVALLLLIIFSAQPALSHNEVVHRDMVDLTYQLMRISLIPTRGQAISVFAPPEGSDPNEWAAFLAAVRSAPPKFHNRPSDLGKLKPPKTTNCGQKMYQDQVLPDRWWDKKAGELSYPVAIDFEDSGDCGANSDYKPGGIFEPVDPDFDRRKLDHTGTTLGFWAASVDRQLNDTHLWFRPTNAGFVGAANKFLDDIGDKALGALLLPIVCGLNCLFDDCDGCDDDAKDIADAANVWTTPAVGYQAYQASMLAVPIGWAFGIT